VGEGGEREGVHTSISSLRANSLSLASPKMVFVVVRDVTSDSGMRADLIAVDRDDNWPLQVQCKAVECSAAGDTHQCRPAEQREKSACEMDRGNREPSRKGEKRQTQSVGGATHR
jgi:hypothetical protein